MTKKQFVERLLAEAVVLGPASARYYRQVKPKRSDLQSGVWVYEMSRHGYPWWVLYDRLSDAVTNVLAQREQGFPSRLDIVRGGYRLQDVPDDYLAELIAVEDYLRDRRSR